MMTLPPSGIKADRTTRELTITWSDGHVSVYPFGLLRAACPCAACRGGHENMRSDPDAEVFKARLPLSPKTRLSNLEMVGTYAISPAWEDGHHSGHYTWQYLRALCPCPQCRPPASSTTS